MTSLVRWTIGSALVLVALVCPRPAAGQALLQQVRDLYAAAAYEDALAMIATKADEVPRVPELGIYRVSCLVALNRPDDAERAIEEIVHAHPRYQPANADAAPRIREIFRDTRARILPEILRRMYADAKASFEKKDRAGAVAGFERVLEVIDAGSDKPAGTLAEIRFLTAGFLDLSRALPEPEPPAAEPHAPTPAPASAPPTGAVVPPQPINQVLPRWQPPNEASRRTVFSGAVRVLISASGKVESAEILQSVHPAYDPQLLFAAKSWLYRPATRNGVPIPSEKIVQVELRPR